MVDYTLRCFQDLLAGELELNMINNHRSAVGTRYRFTDGTPELIKISTILQPMIGIKSC